MVWIMVPVEQTQIFFSPLGMQRRESSVEIVALPLLVEAFALVFEGAAVIDAVEGVDPEPPADAEFALWAVLVGCSVFDPTDGLLVRDIVALFGIDRDGFCRLQTRSRFWMFNGLSA